MTFKINFKKFCHGKENDSNSPDFEFKKIPNCQSLMITSKNKVAKSIEGF
jgi:hypothetical protein